MSKKYFKTVYQLTVLSEDTPVNPNKNLLDVLYECEHGGFSGQLKIDSVTELSESDCAQELIAQGSSPEFFDIVSERH
jgi:hypothetical protein